MTTIRLGYQIRTGKPVNIPLAHTAVTGQTQQSGKTTTLEALVHRSGRCAVAFVTKRGEGSFRDAITIPPYFRDRADWEFVSAILEAMLGERMKFERSWIIDACNGAETLQDVAANVSDRLHGVHSVAWLEWKKAPIPKGKKKKPRAPNEWRIKPAGGLNRSVLTTLDAYLKKVVPILNKLPYVAELKLHAGLNVMDLSPYPTEIQSLVIRSVLEWVYEYEKQTIVIIPEAWEFIPQNRRSPVLLAAEELIRKGGALENFLWLDSQDIAAVHKNVLRSIRVWILGVQREANEVKRTLAHIPKAPPAAELMTLPRGQFFYSCNDELARVYVQPFWVGDAHAQAVAKGEEDIASVEKIWREKRTSFRSQARAASPNEAVETKNAAPDPSNESRSPRTDGLAFTAASDAVGKAGRAASESREAAKTSHHPHGTKVAPDSTVPQQLANHASVPESSEEKEMLDTLTDAELEKLVEHLKYRGWPSSDHPMDTASEKIKAELNRRKNGAVPATGLYPQKPSPDLNWNAEIVPLDDENAAAMEAWLLKHPVLIELLRQTPTLKVTVRRPTLAMDDSTLQGKIAVLIAEGFFNEPKVERAVYDELRKRWGAPGQVAHVYQPLKKFNNDAVLTYVAGIGYQVSPALRIETVNA